MMSTFFSEQKILESSLVLLTLYGRNLDMLKCLLYYGIAWSSFNLIVFPMTLSHEKVWSRVWDCRSFFGIVGLFLVKEVQGTWKQVQGLDFERSLVHRVL